MMRSVIAVVVGYAIFSLSALALFKITGKDPHSPADVPFMAATIVYGIFFAGLGGYVAAWLAKRWEIEHSLAVSCLIAVVGAISLLTRPQHAAMWTQLAALLLMAPAAMLGGRLRSRQAPAGRG